jgi:hypothetical protein
MQGERVRHMPCEIGMKLRRKQVEATELRVAAAQDLIDGTSETSESRHARYASALLHEDLNRRVLRNHREDCDDCSTQPKRSFP